LSPRMSLAGRTVLITGAARGIGAELAKRATAAGAHVALVGLEPERLERLAADLGPGSTWAECDVTDLAATERAVAATLEAHGRIDVVVANAGIAPHGTVAASPAEVTIRTIEVNLLGVVKTIKATLPSIIERKGHLLLISSAAAFMVLPGMSAYGAAKAGVEQFANGLRLELSHKGITVGSAHPIWIDTDMVRDLKDDLPSFRQSLRQLPPPLGTQVSVGDCAAALLDGIERRARRIYVPRSLALVSAMRTVMNSALVEKLALRASAQMVPTFEAEVAATGRSFGTHSAETLRSADR
jgi:NAD(P)-dependent dehydrogenase (short-subunit alcohol dehydrogenase family)